MMKTSERRWGEARRERRAASKAKEPRVGSRCVKSKRNACREGSDDLLQVAAKKQS